MDIAVCIKRVPDTEAQIRPSGDGGIDESGVKFIMSPYDEFAVEAALRLRDAAEEGEVTVTVVTLGSSSSAETLRAALAMGADRALLLEGEASMDGLSTAKDLAPAVEEADLILLGVKAVDDDQQQVGPMLATLLGRPCATAVSVFAVDGGTASVTREVEGGKEKVEVDLPAVLTITKGEFDPRFASLKGIMAAKKKPLEERPVASTDSAIRVEGLENPPPRPPGRIVGEGAEAAGELVRLLREEANVL